MSLAVTATAQQTGRIAGKVTATDGSILPGVTVEARSEVLPQPRVTTTDANGDYSLPALQPGSYTLTFALSGMNTVTRRAEVQLSDTRTVDVALGVAGVAESITVTAEASLVDRESTALSSGVSGEQIQALPVGQDYRDLQKLIPGVQYTEDQVRGVSAGGSGVDNTYHFDGVSVNLPLFGNLSAEPSNHDVAQMTVVKGGAKAVDFDRSGGLKIDTVSKSGTNRFRGTVEFRLQNSDFAADPAIASANRFSEDRAWTTMNLGGPILADRLFFYASYYQPTRARDNRSNNYGELPDYESDRKEYFGKLTFSPTANILLNGSYRDSDREETSNLFGGSQSPTTGVGNSATQKIAIGEGSWVINSRSYATFKYTDYANETLGRPDNTSDAVPSFSLGAKLDIGNLDKMGFLTVPCPTRPTGAPCTVAAATDPNNAITQFIAPYINKYGYESGGVRFGGGTTGFGSEFNDQDFFRTGGQVGYNVTFGTKMTHDLHVGYQRYKDTEDLFRYSNGWGSISIPGGTLCPNTAHCGTQQVFFQATVQQQGARDVPHIVTSYESQNFEINDSIKWNNWSFNAGAIVSNDTLWGQGLKEADNVAGFVSAPGNRYRMYEIPFKDMIQPRLGATWAYNGQDTVYAGYNVYMPATTSLPRAAAWDRNLVATNTVYFDATGTVIGFGPVAGSSGKLFDDGLDPRTIDEYLLGTAQQVTGNWSARVYGRHRYQRHFWEDTNNSARIDCGATVAALRANCQPPSWVPRELYIPNLDDQRRAIGSNGISGNCPTLGACGSTYVIAELDGAFTRYYELTTEHEYRRGNTFLTGSYTWSHYYGNFDQDNSTGADNDANLFVGSSNIADAPGRQIWDFKYGDLRGDRRHMLKLSGAYSLPWNGTVGAWFVYQSGQPWQAESSAFYSHLTTSTTDSNRYMEPAGRRRTDDHHQLDLKYTQRFGLPRGLNLTLAADLFNVFNNTTFYNIQPSVRLASFGQPRSAFGQRRFQLTAGLQF